MILIQCHGKSRAIQCRHIISIHDYLLFVCVHALICMYGTFYVFTDTAVNDLKVCRVQLDTAVDHSARM